MFPSISTYFQTSWGYQGSNHFYIAYFAPATVYTVDSFGGGYSSSLSRWVYSNLTEPNLLPSSKKIQFKYSFNTSRITVSNGILKGLASDNFMMYPSNQSRNVQIFIPLSQSINISDFTTIGIEMELGNSNFVSNLLAHHSLWLGLASPSTVGWYIVGDGVNSHVSMFSNGTEDFLLTVGEPTPLWSSNTYAPSSVTGVLLQFPDNQSQTIFSLPTLFATKGYVINSNWFDLVSEYGIQYLLLDKSVIGGNLTSSRFNQITLSTLQANDDALVIFNGTYLELLKVK